MSGIGSLQLEHLDKKLLPLEDKHLIGLKQEWYDNPQKSISHDDFVAKASEWFKSTKLNDLHGWVITLLVIFQ